MPQPPEDVVQTLARLRRDQATVQQEIQALQPLHQKERDIAVAIQAIERLYGLREPEDMEMVPATTISNNGILGLSSTAYAGLGTTGRATLSFVKTPDTALEGVQRILAEAKAPLHIKEIVRQMHARNWFRDRTYEQLRATLVSALNRKAEDGDTFVKVAGVPSTYGLTASKGR